MFNETEMMSFPQNGLYLHCTLCCYVLIRQMGMTLKFLKGPCHVRKRIKEIIIIDSYF